MRISIFQAWLGSLDWPKVKQRWESLKLRKRNVKSLGVSRFRFQEPPTIVEYNYSTSSTLTDPQITLAWLYILQMITQFQCITQFCLRIFKITHRGNVQVLGFLGSRIPLWSQDLGSARLSNRTCITVRMLISTKRVRWEGRGVEWSSHCNDIAIYRSPFH